MTIECCLEVDKRLLFIKHKRKTDYGDFSLSSYLLVLGKLVKHIPSTFFCGRQTNSLPIHTN